MKTKPKYNIIQNVSWMVGLAWRTRKRVLLFVLLEAALGVCVQVVQLFFGPTILGLVEQQVTISHLLGAIGLFTAALFFTKAGEDYIGTNNGYARIDVREEIISKVVEKTCTTSYPNTLSTDFIKLREKANRATEGNREATEHIWPTLMFLLKNVAGFVLYVTILTRLNLLLLMLIVATCGVNFFVARYVNNWMFWHRDDEDRIYAQKAYLRGKAESLELAKDIRIFGLQNWLTDLYRDIHDVYLAFRLKVERKRLLLGFTEAMLTFARNGTAYFFLVRMALNEGLGVPEFLLYFTAVTTFTEWVMGVLNHAAKLHKESLDISSVREFLDYPEPFNLVSGDPVPKTEQYTLTLENVSFRYPGSDFDTIHQMNLTLHAGERLAIVGQNGAGKTTLVKLLCGFFDPTEGRVLLNGIDIRSINRREYYRLFGAVFQDSAVLDMTVLENITQNEEVDMERIQQCVESAGLTKAIEELPNKYDTHLGREVYLDGTLFSGGQTQRLLLARTLYKDAPILLLDEPTAALDPIAEDDIYQKYGRMTDGKSSLFISHRLASTRFCDRILYLQDGVIAEEGTHEELMQAKGEYASLFEIQSRYYREGRDF